MLASLPTPASSRTPSRLPASWPAPPRLLVVEDDADLHTVLARVARSIAPGACLDWATRVQEALALVTHRSYDLVLADCLLPGRRRGENLEAVCACMLPGVPFALMTALRPDEISRRPDGSLPPLLQKPFSVHDCRRFLEPLLHTGRHRHPGTRWSPQGPGRGRSGPTAA